MITAREQGFRFLLLLLRETARPSACLAGWQLVWICLAEVHESFVKVLWCAIEMQVLEHRQTPWGKLVWLDVFRRKQFHLLDPLLLRWIERAQLEWGFALQ